MFSGTMRHLGGRCYRFSRSRISTSCSSPPTRQLGVVGRIYRLCILPHPWIFQTFTTLLKHICAEDIQAICELNKRLIASRTKPISTTRAMGRYRKTIVSGTGKAQGDGSLSRQSCMGRLVGTAWKTIKLRSWVLLGLPGAWCSRAET
jgi:hypothetical protein